MKRHLMTVMALMAAWAAFGEAYDPAKHGNPIVVTSGTADIDGNGAVIDAKGLARCATLGPNVTIRNFILKNGKAELGGGVYGGKVVNCEITGCRATESAAALCNSVAENCTIKGNAFDNGSSTAAAHGGILFGSALTGCTITGNTVRFGSEAPAFGGIGERVTMTGCTVKDNTVSAGELICYGMLYADSTVDGNGIEFKDDEDPTQPTDPTQPDPSAPLGPWDGRFYDDSEVGEFQTGVATTYNGWLRHGKTIVAAIQVRTSASLSGAPVKTLLSVTPIGGKRETYRSAVVAQGGGFVDGFGVRYANEELAGTVSGISNVPNGVTVEAVKDFSKSKVPAEKARMASVPVGCRTLALPTADGGYDCFSMTIDKRGKASVKGTLDDGTLVSMSAQGVLGSGIFVVPVVYSKNVASKVTRIKRLVTFAFLLWIDLNDGTARITDETGGRWTGDERAISHGWTIGRPADGGYGIRFETPAAYLVASNDGVSLTPNGESIGVVGKKWSAAQSVGSVEYDAAVGVYVNVGKGKMPSNVSKFKLTYMEKLGLVKGLFKLYYLMPSEVKTDSVKVTGIVVDGVFYGNAVIMKKGLSAIWWEREY